MTEKPIIFSTQMVQAILEGRKSQTRRIVKPQPIIDSNSGYVFCGRHKSIYKNDPHHEDWKIRFIKDHCPYGQPGNILWVRESYSPDYFRQGEHGYKADWTELSKEYLPAPKWKTSIHMPRSAARIFLKVENVRIERLHKISEADAEKEGVIPMIQSVFGASEAIEQNNVVYDIAPSKYRDGFSFLWDKINGFRAPWASNPWVWVIEFSRRE